MPRILGWDGCLQAVDEHANSAGPALDCGGSNANACPGLGQGVRMLVRHGVQQTLDEQVLDVDPDVMVVEWQIDRSLDGQNIGFLTFTNTALTLCCFTIEEDRPALLQECEEYLPVRDQRLKRPVVEEGALAQALSRPANPDSP